MKKTARRFFILDPHAKRPEERKTTMETETKPQVKKEWTKPELLVLVRSNPEEAVLTTCKTSVHVGDNAAQDGTCRYLGSGYCRVCLSTIGS